MTRYLAFVLLAGCFAMAQPPQSAARATAPVSIDQPDARRTREELSRLLDKYPPSLRSVLALDHSLLTNSAYLAPYPGLVTFLNGHPDVARDASYFVGDGPGNRFPRDPSSQAYDLWRSVITGLAAFLAFGMGIALVMWLIRTLVDYRRWSRLAKVQTEVHSKLLDRFTANADVLAYIQSSAGSNFLQSAPIRLDSGPRSVGAPLGRILWSVQGGLVLVAAGIGFSIISGRVAEEAAQPVQALGILAVALGIGFVASAVLSFVISRRLGLIEGGLARRSEQTGVTQD